SRMDTSRSNSRLSGDSFELVEELPSSPGNTTVDMESPKSIIINFKHYKDEKEEEKVDGETDVMPIEDATDISSLNDLASLRAAARSLVQPQPRLIRMERNPRTLEFGYTWEHDPYFYPYVECVSKRSPAFHAGLKDGDRILSVNGTKTRVGMDENEMEALFREYGSDVLLVIDEEGAEWYEKRRIPIPIVVSTEKEDYVDDDDSLLNSLIQHSAARIVEMRRSTIHNVFGLDCDYEPYHFPLVYSVNTRSPAAQAGLYVGDRILSVNGKCTLRMRYYKVNRLISQSGLTCQLVVIDAKIADAFVSCDAPVARPEEELEGGVELEKSAVEEEDKKSDQSVARLISMDRISMHHMYGYCKEEQPYFYPIVTYVYKKSPAEKAGLRVGDYIISVDGEHMIGQGGYHSNPKADKRTLTRKMMVVDEKGMERHEMTGGHFQIPDNDVEDDVKEEKKKEDAKEDKQVTGVSVDIDLTEAVAREILLKKSNVSDVFGYGWQADASFFALVTDVKEGSPAFCAGLRAGDRILSICGKSTFGIKADMANELFEGEVLEQELLVIDDECAEMWNMMNRETAPIDIANATLRSEYAARVIRTERNAPKKFFGYRWRAEPSHYPTIVHVSDGSQAFNAGLRAGDLILSINGVSAYRSQFEQVNNLFGRCDDRLQLIVVKGGGGFWKIDDRLTRLAWDDFDEERMNAEFEAMKIEEREVSQTMKQVRRLRFIDDKDDDEKEDETKRDTSDQYIPRPIIMEKDSSIDVFGYGWLEDPAFFPIVIDVEENSPASRAGLKAGDRMLIINGTSSFGCNQDEANQLFGLCGEYQQLLVIDDDEAYCWYEKNRDAFPATDEKGDNEQPVPLVIRMERESIIDLFGYRWKADISYYPVVVSVDEESPAFESCLSKGDLILSINGLSTYGATTERVEELIRLSELRQQLVVISDKEDEEEEEDNNDEVAARLVHLKRQTNDGAFGYYWKENPSFHPIITEVFEGTPAFSAGMKTDDRILMMNGTSTAGKNWHQVREMFYRCGKEQKLIVIDEERAKWHEKNGLPIPMPSAEEKTDDHTSRVVKMVRKAGNRWLGFGWNSHADVYPVVANVEKKSVAAKAGLKVGDRILSINGKKTLNTEEKISDLLNSNIDCELVVIDEKGANALEPSATQKPSN
ncbi:hypothetical protein PFISCL1PPCAC_12175, partial [Pristionchus fissidentatus]